LNKGELVRNDFFEEVRSRLDQPPPTDATHLDGEASTHLPLFFFSLAQLRAALFHLINDQANILRSILAGDQERALMLHDDQVIDPK